MRGTRALFAALVLAAAAPAWAQPAEAPTTTVPEAADEVVAPVPGGEPDYAAWQETAQRAEALSEAGRGSAFALNKLREELVTWREVFAAAQAANAARIATVQAQADALGPAPAEGEPAEDTRVAERRGALQQQLSRLRAPGLLAQEAYVHADGLVGEIDILTRSRQAAALLSRSAPPLDPRIWPDMADAMGTRLMGLWKEVTTSVRSEPRREVFARNWPLAVAMLGVGLLLLTRGRTWLGRVGAKTAVNRPKGRFRGPHAANVIRLGLSIANALMPLLGFVALAGAVEATGLFGTRALALVESIPLGAACVVATGWLAGRFFSADRASPAPFDFQPDLKVSAGGRLRQAGWILAAALVARAFLVVGDIAPEVRAGLMLPIYLLLALVVFQFGRCLVTAGHPREADDESVLFRRRMVTFVGRAMLGVAVVSPVLMLLGFHRAGSALLMPSVITLGLVGLLIVLQWLATDLYALLMRREDGIRDALLPVLVGFALFLVAVPILALIWGARPEDLAEAWTRFLSGITLGETRLSPRQFATFGLVFGLGWFLTRLVQGTLRSTVLPRTRFDAGAQNAVVAGLGYLGLTLAALLAFTVAGLDLSNLAIVA
ncbi:MAG TPA: DUF3772 domain-containing protein, partial [Rubellimicrobium sp.]|nr:DUF3772 domain-containing protein [Rubellimicrobium sp.]